MTTILRIDSSSRPAEDGAGGSFSRALADAVVAGLAARDADARIVARDLVADPVGHVADATIKGYYTPPDLMTPDLVAATALSDTLIAELKAADAVVISVPIYNFTVPSALKAWIDQVVRMGRTFGYEDGAFHGLVADKPTYLVLSYGAPGYAPGGPLEAMDFLRPYLVALMRFIGLTSVEVVAVEGTTAPDAADRLAVAKADVAARLALEAA